MRSHLQARAHGNMTDVLIPSQTASAGARSVAYPPPPYVRLGSLLLPRLCLQLLHLRDRGPGQFLGRRDSGSTGSLVQAAFGVQSLGVPSIFPIWELCAPGRLLHLSELPRVYLAQSNLRGCEYPVFTSQATPRLAVLRNWLCHLLI